MNNLLLNNKAKGPGAKIYFCKVVRFYASSNTVDVVSIDDNISLTGCNIVCSTPAGFAYGARYIPTHDDQNSEVEYVNSAGDIYCVATFLDNDYNNAAVLGFIFPLETTLSISEYGLYIFRHESDVMWMVRGDGTVQMYHPSGSIIKIGDTNINEMTDQIEEAGLYPAKTAGLYVRPADDYNKNKSSNLFIRWYAGQTISLNSDGTIDITAPEDININSDKDINVAAGADVNVTASGNASVHAAGAVSVTSDTVATVTGQNGVNISSSGGAVAIQGTSITVQGGAASMTVLGGAVAIQGTSVTVQGATGSPSTSTPYKYTWT